MDQSGFYMSLIATDKATNLNFNVGTPLTDAEFRVLKTLFKVGLLPLAYCFAVTQ